MRFFSVAVLAIVAIADHAFAADAATCAAYAREATAKAQGVRMLACGYDAAAPRWSGDRAAHARWCRAASKEAVELETAERRKDLGRCQSCRAYANLAVAAAADNIKLRCGLDGPRWSGNAGPHFQWCMALGADADVATASATSGVESPLSRETGGRTRQIAECKARNAGKDSSRRAN